jgi:hypothetical protein
MRYVTQQYTARDAADFERFFHVKLSQYWHGPLLGFDITGFDEEVLKSGTMSCRAAIQQTYGQDAASLVARLVGAE